MRAVVDALRDRGSLAKQCWGAFRPECRSIGLIKSRMFGHAELRPISRSDGGRTSAAVGHIDRRAEITARCSGVSDGRAKRAELSGGRGSDR